MADVAKSAVRLDCTETGGGDEAEEEEPSLSAAIESELRGVLGKSWKAAVGGGELGAAPAWPDSGGWATVEEVALELAASSPPVQQQLNGHASEKLTECRLTNDHKPPQVDSGLPPTPDTDLEATSEPDSLSPVQAGSPDPSSPGTPEKDTKPLGEILKHIPSPERTDEDPVHPPTNVQTFNHVHSSTPATPENPELILTTEGTDMSSQSPERTTSALPQTPVMSPVSPLITETPPTPTRTAPPDSPKLSFSPEVESLVQNEVRNCMESVLIEVSKEEVITNGQHIEETELSESTVVEKKKKKKTVINGDSAEEVTTAKKKTKKSKKTEGKENSHISVKSSFSKFDQLSKKTVLHVRSSDPAKAHKTFSQGSTDSQSEIICKACQKQVFVVEKVMAERANWHKNCFRCNTCNKQLTVDTYQSHEGTLYCKPHFRELFAPKAVIDNPDEPIRRRKPEMIIRENQPVELPPDVVRASDKPDLGLEELSSLNVKSRFQVFEKQDQTDGELERSPTTVSVKRSSSIMSKLAKFQKKGMDVGVTDESLNGFVYEESSSSSEEESEEDGDEDKGVIKCRRKGRERPVSFGKMDDVKKNWESLNQSQRREEIREERKLEMQNIRSRMFQGKQGKMKELYEQAVLESQESRGRKESVKEDEELSSLSDKTKLVRERFEKGEVGGEGHEGSKKELEEDLAVFEEGISKKSRNIFKEMDASVKSAPVVPAHQPSQIARTESVKRSRETDSPEREVYRDPDVVRCDDKAEDESSLFRSQTASRMLSVFRQMEEQKETLPDGPKPKKCFTPPPDYKGSGSSDEGGSSEEELEETEGEEEEESENEEGVIKSSYKVKDEFLDQARNAARAKQLAAKFEQWEPEKQSTNNAINMLESDHASIESTKSLKARFESLQNDQPKEKSRPKVNRFVEQPPPNLCAFCDTKVYPLEKIETNGKIFHKNCFRCSYCNCVLRMDTYTLNNGNLYCLPHFKQLFISKGNYDEGFGSDQHKRKWEQPVNGNISS